MKKETVLCLLSILIFTGCSSNNDNIKQVNNKVLVDMSMVELDSKNFEDNDKYLQEYSQITYNQLESAIENLQNKLNEDLNILSKNYLQEIEEAKTKGFVQSDILRITQAHQNNEMKLYKKYEKDISDIEKTINTQVENEFEKIKNSEKELYDKELEKINGELDSGNTNQ